MCSPESKLTVEEITERALRLPQIEAETVKHITNEDTAAFQRAIVEFAKTKLELKTALMYLPVLVIADTSARETVDKVRSGDLFDIERVFQGTPLGKALTSGLVPDENEDLQEWFAQASFDPARIVRNLYDIACVILGVGSIPKYLTPYVTELRECYSLDRHLAAYSLSRTVLEIAVREFCVGKGYVDGNTGKILQSRALQDSKKAGGRANLRWMIEKICDEPAYSGLSTQLDDIRDRTNVIVHGGKIVGQDEAREMVKETFAAIHALYAVST